MTAKGIPRRVHLVGIGGVHMSAIAHVLLAWGHQISGSDQRLSPLTERLQAEGVTIYQGHAASHLGDAELVVYTAAARPDNPELVEAKRRGLPLLQRAEMIARLLEGRQAIAVAGSHGKTTTSALIAFMLQEAGCDPTFLVGGEVIDLGTNARAGRGEHIVVEADEFAGAFLHYRPQVAVVTNIEPDHLDFYGSFQRLTAAFRQFMSQVAADGFLIACADDPTVRHILAHPEDDPPIQARIIRYGLQEHGGFFAENISPKGICGYTFLLKYGAEPSTAFETHLTGVHQVNNALAAIATASVLGLPRLAVGEALARFRGVERRFQFVGEAAEITIMDDYAHHPTEIQATIAAARQRFPGRRLVCLFQPHTYSRTQYLLDGFRTCFQGVDQLLIAETYAAREEPSAGMSAQELAQAIDSPPASYVGGLEEAPLRVMKALRPGDVFFTIGAGDIDQVGTQVLEALRKAP
ncbi:MAG: UDP-N-acetylmuramate--L-alanine ligase [Dehalococcoidia bacterium]|nr:UDP-N-acetylmuramate--L-alanine ligase [Dehalococcoidia bacterium]